MGRLKQIGVWIIVFLLWLSSTPILAEEDPATDSAAPQESLELCSQLALSQVQHIKKKDRRKTNHRLLQQINYLVAERDRLQQERDEERLHREIAEDDLKYAIIQAHEAQQNHAQMIHDIEALRSAQYTQGKKIGTPENTTSIARQLITLPKTCEDVVSTMQSLFPQRLVFTNRTFSMAKNLKFCTSERVDQLWMAIMQLATSYYELRTETSSLKANLEDAVNEAMQQRIGKKFEFSPREMPVTANHPVFGKQRRDSHPDIGQFDAMEHLKGRDGFRLYFFWHKESKRIFISAFPEHLPSVSKP